jgi:hypothetical protein
MKQKSGSLGKKRKNKIDRALANLTKMKRDKIQIIKIKNAKGKITTNTTDILINLKILNKWTDF